MSALAPPRTSSKPARGARRTCSSYLTPKLEHRRAMAPAGRRPPATLVWIKHVTPLGRLRHRTRYPEGPFARHLRPYGLLAFSSQTFLKYYIDGARECQGPTMCQKCHIRPFLFLALISTQYRNLSGFSLLSKIKCSQRYFLLLKTNLLWPFNYRQTSILPFNFKTGYL